MPLALHVASLLLASAPPAEPPPEPSRQLAGVERPLVLPPGPGNPRNSEGDFVRLNDGRVLFIYTHFTGGTGDHAAAYLAAWFSDDGGKTWTAEDAPVLENEAGMNVMSVSLLRLATGEVALFYLAKNSLTDCRPRMRLSADEARSWGEPVECIAEPGYYVLNNDRAVQLSGGRIVLPVALHNTPAQDRFDPAAEISCRLSDDGGRTWRRSETAQKPEGLTLQEPGVIELKDGRLMMFCRTPHGGQYVSYSEDGGEVWSGFEPSGIVSPLSPASIERTPGTGDLLLVWNDHSGVAPELRGRRTPLSVAVSRDDGKTWGPSRAVESDPEGWYCYTAIEFVGDDVLLGHCAGDRRTGGLSTTQITRFPVAALYAPNEVGR